MCRMCLGIRNSLYCCFSSVFTLNLSVIRLVDACFHNTIYLHKKTAELRDVTNPVVLIEAATTERHTSTAQTKYAGQDDATRYDSKTGDTAFQQ